MAAAAAPGGGAQLRAIRRCRRDEGDAGNAAPLADLYTWGPKQMGLRGSRQALPNFSMQQMALSAFAVTSASSHGNALSALHARHSQRLHTRRVRSQVQALAQTQLQYKKLGDSDLLISEVTLGTMTFGEQNTEKEAHDMLSYSFDQGINILDTAEIYPVPTKKETQGSTDLYIGRWMQSKPRDKIILATKVAGYSQRSPYLRDNANVVRVDAANIKESVEKSLKRLSTDYIDLLQIHWSVRYIGVSNETSYGVMEFVHAARAQGLPKIVSIQNSYSLIVRCRFEVDLVEVCHPNNCNVGLLAYSPLAGGVLTGKYLDANANISKRSRLNLFPGYMARYKASLAKEATNEYVKLAKKHGLTPVQLALGFVRDRPFTASSIIGATTMDQLKENIDAFTSAPRPLPQEILDGIEDLFKRYKDPAIL
ncbi:Protein tas [Dichanthelium oligosanthes]|uniref:Protein tas n=1 Tax=Dichanthelium oligosanthes TaxID=888268 RepID=A0A1E5VYK9_9POAL|nr:Protein tas [Dichanthelium oligosanthes]